MLVCFLFGEGIDYPGIGTFTLKNQVQFKIMPMNIRADMQNENQNRMEMILENLFHYSRYSLKRISITFCKRFFPIQFKSFVRNDKSFL
jgi:hypothetical protein